MKTDWGYSASLTLPKLAPTSNWRRSLFAVRLALILVAACFSISSQAQDRLKGEHVYRLDSSETVFRSMNQACAAFLQKNFPGKSLVKAKDYGPNGHLECYWKEADGSENNTFGGSHEVLCPEHASLEDANSPLECACLSDYQLSAGQCVSQASRLRSKEELLSTPQKRDGEGCGLNKTQQEAIRSILGQTFTNVPYLKAAWDKAVSDDFKLAVAKLKADPKTNEQGRRNYFAPTRNKFWANLKEDSDATKAFDKAGIKFPLTGKAAIIVIDGKPQTIDVDHIVGLAENPKLMITTGNLQLSPQRENRVLLEKIARNDAFYDPEAWMKLREEEAAMKCSKGGKGKK